MSKTLENASILLQHTEFRRACLFRILKHHYRTEKVEVMKEARSAITQDVLAIWWWIT